MDYFDLHCDVLSRCLTEGLDFKSPLLSVNQTSSKIFKRYCQSFAIWTPANVADKTDFFKKSVSLFKDEILPLKNDSFTPVLSVEGADFLADDLSLLSVLSDNNVFSLSLTWNYENQFAGGALSDAGLKALGKELIYELNKKTIALDVSHLNRKSFFDAIEYAENVIATHSYIDLICENPRNLTLEQMKLLRDRNGLIGLCFYPDFLGSEDVFEQIYRSIDFCIENDLIENIAFGGDFDGADIPFSLGEIPDMYHYLSSRGIDENILSSVFFQNAYDYYIDLTTTDN